MFASPSNFIWIGEKKYENGNIKRAISMREVYNANIWIKTKQKQNET